MKSSVQSSHLKKLIREKQEGFSLIELVIVVSVLAVLSAIAIPSFTCFQRKAQATAALAAMKQIQTECEINNMNKENSKTFTPSNLNSYQIQSDGSNGCSGASETGLIIAIPNETEILPTFVLSTNSRELTYTFKGKTGSDLSNGLSLVCSAANGYIGASARQANIEANSFVIKDTYIERGCSAYVLVDGPNWSFLKRCSVCVRRLSKGTITRAKCKTFCREKNPEKLERGGPCLSKVIAAKGSDVLNADLHFTIEAAKTQLVLIATEKVW